VDTPRQITRRFATETVLCTLDKGDMTPYISPLWQEISPPVSAFGPLRQNYNHDYLNCVRGESQELNYGSSYGIA